MYEPLFYTHVTCAIASISLFCVRGFWMLTDNSLLDHRVVRVAPHVIDTILLASAIALTFQINHFPFLNAWLTVKFFALITYIILGTIALRRGKTKRHRTVAFVLSVGIFAFIVSVAYYHHPLGVFIWL
jgi:uncharacterized membrane protein SirB2